MAQDPDQTNKIQAWFLHGLNKEVQDALELQQYKTMSKLVYQAIKVEMQTRRRNASKRTYRGSSSWKGKYKDKDRARRNEISTGHKALTPTPTLILPKASIIKHLKYLGKGHIASEYPNSHVMIVKEDREIGSESSTREASTTSESKCLSDGSHYEGDLFVVRRLMNSQVREEAET
ncbi:hypothetical protein CR513_45767, partial [Mucuna pruriens]